MLDHEQHWLREQLRTCVGTHATLMSADPQTSAAELFTDFYALVSLSDDQRDNAAVCCEFDQLPLPNESMDVVVLQHVTNQHKDPVGILREAERVLVPGGRLLLLAANPFSLLGLKMLLPGKRSPFGRYRSASQLKEWLRAMDIQLLSRRCVLFEPPVNRHWLLNACWRFSLWCSRVGLPFGGVYCLSAIKSARPVNPLPAKTLNWQPQAVRSALQAAVKNQQDDAG